MHDMGKIFISAAVLLCESRREKKSVRVKRHVIQGAGARGRIAFVSDLHGRRDQDEILGKISRLKPDLILSGGDLVTAEDEKSHTEAKRFISGLVKIAPVYAGNGNHERRMRDYVSYTAFLERKGVCILSDAGRCVSLKEGTVRISGVDIPQEFYRLFERRQVSPAMLEKKTGRADGSVFNILLMHNPAHYQAGALCGADLVLGGHMHGGIVSLPFGRGLISPQAKLFPHYAWGHAQKNGVHFITSRGLGSHTVNLRLFNSPEIIVIDLEK